MGRYVKGRDRQQVTLLPECLEDYIAEDNPVRVVEAKAVVAREASPYGWFKAETVNRTR